jgi:hypothetical protein
MLKGASTVGTNGACSLAHDSLISPPTTLSTFSKPHGIPASMLQIRPTQFHLKMLSLATGLALQAWYFPLFSSLPCVEAHISLSRQTPSSSTQSFTIRLLCATPDLLIEDRLVAEQGSCESLVGADWLRLAFGLPRRRFNPVGLHGPPTMQLPKSFDYSSQYRRKIDLPFQINNVRKIMPQSP